MPSSFPRILPVALLAAAFAATGAHGHAPAAASGHGGHSVHEAHAHGAGQGAHPAPAARPAERAAVRFADVVLSDQDGRPVRLQRDVVDGHIVVVDFVYTSCTTVCPVASAIMAGVQARLGARVGHDVRLISLTVDPARDTPARLREYARSHGAGEGWTWLTGSVSAVNETLKGFGTWTPNFEDHPVVTMVGDGRSGEWTRFYGFTDPESLVTRVEELMAARAATRGKSMTAARE